MNASRDMTRALVLMRDAELALDEYIGDSDITHFETDQAWRENDPAGWALMKLNAAIETLQCAKSQEFIGRARAARRKCKCPCHSSKRIAGSRFYHAFPCCDEAADFPATPESPEGGV